MNKPKIVTAVIAGLGPNGYRIAIHAMGEMALYPTDDQGPKKDELFE